MVSPHDDPIELVTSRYEQHKRATASRTDDLGTYSRAKSDVVEQLLAAARNLDRSFDFEVPEGP